MRDFEKFTQNSHTRRHRKWIGYLVVALVLAAGLGALASATPLSGGDQSPTEKPSRIVPGAPQTLANISDEPRNVLVGGVDRRPEANSEVEGSRMDTMMLVRVYPDTGEIRIVSIPRDFLVEIGPSVETKINAAYSYGGASGAIRAVEDFSNVDVDHYIVVDFAGFEALVDAIGGLRIDVEEGQVPPHWKVKDGIQRLSGRKALIYTRYRNTSGGDLDRIRRQQKALAALRSQALRWQSAKRFLQITRAVVENVDTDLSLPELASLGRIMAGHGRNGLMTSTQLKGTPTTLRNGSQVLVPDEAVNEEILREFRD